MLFASKKHFILDIIVHYFLNISSFLPRLFEYLNECSLIRVITNYVMCIKNILNRCDIATIRHDHYKSVVNRCMFIMTFSRSYRYARLFTDKHVMGGV